MSYVLLVFGLVVLVVLMLPGAKIKFAGEAPTNFTERILGYTMAYIAVITCFVGAAVCRYFGW